jgi:hypothetical protein
MLSHNRRNRAFTLDDIARSLGSIPINAITDGAVYRALDMIESRNHRNLVVSNRSKA